MASNDSARDEEIAVFQRSGKLVSVRNLPYVMSRTQLESDIRGHISTPQSNGAVRFLWPGPRNAEYFGPERHDGKVLLGFRKKSDAQIADDEPHGEETSRKRPRQDSSNTWEQSNVVFNFHGASYGDRPNATFTATAPTIFEVPAVLLNNVNPNSGPIPASADLMTPITQMANWAWQQMEDLKKENRRLAGETGRLTGENRKLEGRNRQLEKENQDVRMANQRLKAQSTGPVPDQASSVGGAVFLPKKEPEIKTEKPEGQGYVSVKKEEAGQG